MNFDATLSPFTATVELDVKLVPSSIREAAVFTGPPVGEMDISVGGGGFVMEAVTLFEVEGVAAMLDTVTVAVPVAVRRLAGT
jgi:hypothetical protein